MNSGVVVCLAFFCAWALVGLVRAAAVHFGVLDLPNSRSSHDRAVPRGGGIAIVALAFAAAIAAFCVKALSLWLLVAWTVGGGLVALAGLLDDVRGVSPLLRLTLHFSAALILFWSLKHMPEVWSPRGPLVVQVLMWASGIVATVWSINLFNFMDGINGVAAAQCIFVAGSAAYFLSGSKADWREFLPLFALCGGALGFLVWNFPVAKIFMGDVGSGFIGFALMAAALLYGGYGVSLWTWVALNGIFIADSSVTLLVRLLNGERVYVAHRNHAYQRAARRLGSHTATTLIICAINLIWCLPFAALTVRHPKTAYLWTMASLLPLLVAVAAVGAGKPAERSAVS